MTQDNKKRLAAEKAVSFVPLNEVIGVGTGSTVNYFIEALADIKNDIKGAISSSEETTKRLKQTGIEVFQLNEVSHIPFYFDGADEVNHSLHMIKGGGGALLGEKIVANNSERFVCMVDDSKYVQALGKFPLPVEVVPLSRSYVARELVKLGGVPELRMNFITDSGHEILDVRELKFHGLIELEDRINRIPGVVENGLFARRPADVLIVAKDSGVEVIEFPQVR